MSRIRVVSPPSFHSLFIELCQIPMNRWLSTLSTESPGFLFKFFRMVILLLYTIKVKKNKIIKKIVKNHDTHDTHDTQPAIHRAFLEYSTFF